MKEVSADKGYISMKNLQTTVDHGAMPFIPFKSNAQPDRGTDVWSKMFFLLQLQARGILGPLSQAVKRRNRVSDDQSRSLASDCGVRHETAQINEALTKVLAIICAL